MGFDNVFEEVGEFGRYQIILLILLSIPGCIQNAFNGFLPIFLLYTPDFTCASNISDQLSTGHHCQTNASDPEPCQSYKFNTDFFDSTLVTRWNLVCDKNILPKLSLTIIEIYALIGCVTLSILQDKLGRKKVIFICCTLFLIGNLSSLPINSFMPYVFVKAIASFAAISTWNSSYVLLLELVGPSKRTLASTLMCVMYAFAVCLTGFVAYLCRDWFNLTLVTTVPFVIVYSFVIFIPESPRWLMEKGKRKQVRKVIKNISYWNGKKVSEERLDQLIQQIEDSEENEKSSRTGQLECVSTESERHHLNNSQSKQQLSWLWGKIFDNFTLLALFRTPNLRKKTIIITIAWVANSVTYMTIPYNIENIGGNFFVAFIIQGAMEAPGTLMNLFLLNRFGRIIPQSGLMFICSAACFMIPLGSIIGDWFKIMLTVVGKLCICASYIIIYQLASEIYPTTLRGSGTGFSSVVGSVANIAMPYLVHTSTIYQDLPMIILGVITLIGGFFTLLLPETHGKDMPETAMEAENDNDVGIKAFKSHLSRLYMYVRCIEQ